MEIGGAVAIATAVRLFQRWRRAKRGSVLRHATSFRCPIDTATMQNTCCRKVCPCCATCNKACNCSLVLPKAMAGTKVALLGKVGLASAGLAAAGGAALRHPAAQGTALQGGGFAALLALCVAVAVLAAAVVVAVAVRGAAERAHELEAPVLLELQQAELEAPAPVAMEV